MDPSPFAWSKRSCGIPFDVVFQIVENGQVHEVMAHKWILGMVSDIFKTMFYATNVGDKAANVIKVEKTTAPAFQIMIDSVYDSKSIGEALWGKSVHEVFDVVNLVERYQIPELMRDVKYHLHEYPITDETVLGVAEDAMEYSNIFEDEAKILLLSCARFLKDKLRDLDSVYAYAAENEDQKEVFSTLLALMQGVTARSEMINDRVYSCIRKHMKYQNYQHGIPKDSIFSSLKEHQISREEVQASLFYLCSVGEIYCTVDEDHFKPTTVDNPIEDSDDDLW